LQRRLAPHVRRNGAWLAREFLANVVAASQLAFFLSGNGRLGQQLVKATVQFAVQLVQLYQYCRDRAKERS
jgi:hypothetical protein